MGDSSPYTFEFFKELRVVFGRKPFLELSPIDRCVAAFLLNHATWKPKTTVDGFPAEPGDTWPSQKRLAELSGLSIRSVQDAIRHLRELGMLERRRDGRGRSFAIYRIRFSDPRPQNGNGKHAPGRGSNTHRGVGLNPQNATAKPADCDVETHTEPRALNKEGSNPGTSADAACAADDAGDDVLFEKNFQELGSAGVTGGNRKRLARVEGLTPNAVRVLVLRVASNRRISQSKTGWIVNSIREGDFPRAATVIPPQELWDFSHAEELLQIGDGAPGKLASMPAKGATLDVLRFTPAPAEHDYTALSRRLMFTPHPPLDSTSSTDIATAEREREQKREAQRKNEEAERTRATQIAKLIGAITPEKFEELKEEWDASPAANAGALPFSITRPACRGFIIERLQLRRGAQNAAV